MSARSSLRSCTIAALVLAGCGKHDPHAGQKKGDLARVKVLAAYMVDNTPRPGAAPECQAGAYVGGYAMTNLTLMKIGDKAWHSDKPENADWINPAALDASSARVLIDPKATPEDKAYAGGDFQAAKFYVVYRVENVDAPLALGVKDPKMSTVATHITKYGTDTIPICTSVFLFQNSKDKLDWAMEHSDKPIIPPEVAQVLRDDLTARYLELAPRVTPAAAGSAPPKS